MSKKKQRKLAQQEPIYDTGCYTLAPEWQTAKTKQTAWEKGQRQGYDEGRKYESEKLASEKARFDTHERSQRLNALTTISSAGAQIIESMARALLSYDKNL